jgi:D-alanyl-D-alanine carboxypeptidase
MKKEEIIAMQKRLGVVPDGFLRALMPKPNPWPKSDQSSLTAFYGRAGDESQLVTFDFPYPIYYEGKLTKKGRCHRKVKDSLLRVLNEIGDRWGSNSGIMEEAQDYGGIYANRNMRGGNSPSLHARGAAIDLDADDNGNHTHWPMVADMPLEIMEAFAREGWLPAGAFWSRDAMHFQATQ